MIMKKLAIIFGAVAMVATTPALAQPRGDGMYTRPVGVQRAGPWEVSLTPRQLIGFSFVKMYHRCHGLWTTETDFYP